MTANAAQASPTQHVAASPPSSGRRFPPTAVLLPIERPVSQRWRERPRCPALRVAPGPWRRGRSRHRRPCRVSLSMQPVGAGRTRRPRAGVRGPVPPDITPDKSPRMLARTIARFGGDNVPLARIDRVPPHRASQSRAVLGVVNALRSASTRHRAGPAGIDDACARHVHGPLRDGRNPGGVDGREKSSRKSRSRKSRLTRDFGRRMLMYRVCAARHILRIAPSACRARFQSSPSGHDSSAPPTTSRQAAARSRCA
jgi:hypothetical protein